MGKFNDFYNMFVKSVVDEHPDRSVFFAPSLPAQRSFDDDRQSYTAVKNIFSDALEKFLTWEANNFNYCEIKQKNDINSRTYRKTFGNEFFKGENYPQALKYYNKSIALAPPNSECVALAYANRSAVLVKMWRPSEEVIGDIERAITNGCPQKFIFKLHERKAQALQYENCCLLATQSYQDALTSLACSDWDEATKEDQKIKIQAQLEKCKMDLLNLVAEPNDAPVQGASASSTSDLPPVLSYGVNPEVPSVSDCLTLSYNAELGRHFIAAKDIKTGDVLAAERSLASVVLPNYFYERCNYCTKRCFVLLPCNKCCWAMFCSEQCRTASAQIHEFECPIVPELYSWDIGDLALLTVRILATFGIPEIHQFLLSKSREEEVDPRTCGMVHGQYSSNLNALYDLPRERGASDLCKQYAMAFSLGHCFKELLPDQDLFQMFFVRAFQCLSNNSWSNDGVFKRGFVANPIQVASVIGVACSLFYFDNDFPHASHTSYPDGQEVVRANQPVKKGTVVNATRGIYLEY